MLFRPIILAAALLLASPAFAEKPTYTLPSLGRDLEGTWEGSFEGVGMGLNIAFTVKTVAANSTVTVDLLDEAHGIPVSAATRNGANIRFELKDIAGTFEGALTDDGFNLQGTWSQAGKRIPLSLHNRAR